MRKIIGALALGLVLSAPALPALASQDGALLVMPASGTLDTPMDVVTSGVCARGVTFVVAVRGKGIDPVTSGNAVGNTELRILEPAQYPGHHAVPLARTLRDYFVANGISAPKGDYHLVFACRNRLDMADLQTFTGTIRIDAKGYRALGESGVALEEFLASSTPEPTAGSTVASPSDASVSDPAPSDSAPSDPGAAGNAGGSQGAAAETPAGDTAAAAGDPASSSGDAAASEALPSPAVIEASATSRQPEQDNTWRYALIGMGAILLAGAAYLGWKARSR